MVAFVLRNSTPTAVAGPAWKPEYESAWGDALGVVAGVMIEGAEAAVLDQAA